MATKEIPETPAPKKQSVLQVVVENNYLKELVTGEIWNRPESEIKAIEEILVKFKTVVAAAYKMHDDELTTRRNIHGSDYGMTLQYFRKPREDKADNKLADEFDMAADS